MIVSTFLLAVTMPGFHPIAEPTPGPLVIMGGGSGSERICALALQLAGGTEAKVLVVPQASSLEESGRHLAERFRGLGAQEPAALDLADLRRARGQVGQADLIWFGGGDQSRLMHELDRAELIDAIRERRQAGATIGGTSAGAAVMSEVMIAGYSGRRGTPEGQRPEIARGLGLWPEAIVDQHFLRRDRIGRLVHAVQQDSDRVGVGIDESTAVIVEGGVFEVVGTSDVIVIDGRATRTEADPSDREGLGDLPAELSIHRLKPGMRFDIDQGKVEPLVGRPDRVGASSAPLPNDIP